MSIPATISLSQAARQPWPAVVVGAGPAGALVAGLLARNGVAVLLVDRAAFPRFKVCGGCLNGRARAALGAAGLVELPRRLGAVELAALHLAAGGRAVRIALPQGHAVSRTALDAALIEAAVRRGAQFLPSTSASLGPCADDSRSLALRGDHGEAHIQARVVIAADGLGGGLLARAGAPAVPVPGSRLGAGTVLAEAPPEYGPGVIWMASGREGYVGAVRLEDGRLGVACALDAAAVRREGGPGPVAARVLRESGRPALALDEAAWRGTPALTRRPPIVAAPRLFAVGDAAGYVEPFTGEGMAWALSGAVALAPLAAEAVHRWVPAQARQWARLHQRQVARRQIACRAAAAVLRRPWLTRWAVAVLAIAPALAGPVVRLLNEARDIPLSRSPQGAA